MSLFLWALLLENMAEEGEKRHHKKHRKGEVYHDIYDYEWMYKNSKIRK